MMSGEKRAGHLAFKTYTSLLDKVRDKLKVGTKALDLDPEIEEVSFQNIKLGKLLFEFFLKILSICKRFLTNGQKC